MEPSPAQADRHSVEHPAPGLIAALNSLPGPAIGGAFFVAAMSGDSLFCVQPPEFCHAPQLRFLSLRHSRAPLRPGPGRGGAGALCAVRLPGGRRPVPAAAARSRLAVTPRWRLDQQRPLRPARPGPAPDRRRTRPPRSTAEKTRSPLQTSRTANNAQAARIQGAEAKLKALRQAVAGAASNAELNQQVQKLQGPVLGPADIAQPLPLL